MPDDQDHHPNDPFGKLTLPKGSSYLRTSEAAVYCRCGKQRLMDWERRGHIQTVRDADGRRFYLLAELDAVMVGGYKPPATKNTVRRPRVQSPEGRADLPDLPFTRPRTAARRRS